MTTADVNDTSRAEPRKPCADLVEEHRESRISDIGRMWRAYQRGHDEHRELGSIWDYGLSIDYVAPDTFSDQREGYLRWQISWGGPSDEFRFYFSPASSRHTPWKVHRVEYWYLDWFDGACDRLSGRDFDLLAEFFDTLVEIGTVDAELKKASDE